MRLFVSLVATAAMFFASSAAFASATWSIDVSTASGTDIGSPLAVGDQVIVDITLRTSAPGEALGLAGSVGGYDTSILSANAGASAVSEAVLVGFATGPGTGFGGLANQRGGALPLQEEDTPGGVEFEYFAGVATVPAAADGSLDISPVNSAAGGPQFRVVLDVIGAGVTGVQVGTFAEFLDAYTGATDNDVNNASFTVVVPEPGTALLMGLGLVGLARAGRRD